MGRIQLKVEEVGRPSEVSPELRYAQLHRQHEKGLASERSWAELCEVCLRLGKIGEAARTLQNVYSPEVAEPLTHLLEQHGVILHGIGPNVPAAARATPVESRPTPPAAPEPKPAKPLPVAAVERTTLIDELQDAGRFLFRDHMPVTVIGLTILFPAMGAVGFLVPPGTGAVTAAIRLLPTVALLAVVLHCARRVLLDASRGLEEPAEFSNMMVDAAGGGLRAITGTLSLLALCLAPAGLGSLIGLPVHETVALGVVGAAYFPVAILGLALRGSWEAVLPPSVLRAAVVDLRITARLVVVFVASLVLPVAALLAATGGAVYLQLSLVGPFLVAPTFLLARVLGRYYYTHGAQLSRALGLAVKQQVLLSPDQIRRPRRRRAPDVRRAPRMRRRKAERVVAANPPLRRARGGEAMRQAVRRQPRPAVARAAAKVPVPEPHPITLGHGHAAMAQTAPQPRARPVARDVSPAAKHGMPGIPAGPTAAGVHSSVAAKPWRPTCSVSEEFNPVGRKERRLGNHRHTPLRGRGQ